MVQWNRRECERESVMTPWQFWEDELSECTSADRGECDVTECCSRRLDCSSLGVVLEKSTSAMPQSPLT